jgi:1,2-diacylglycerol-3-alpha-glucose alpha-1,2-galactosyltransferase
MSSKKLRINMISESEFTVQGHGVHTAFREMTDALAALPDVDIAVNKFRRADITHIHTIGFYSILHLFFSRSKKVISIHIVPDSLVGSIKGTRYWLPGMRLYMRFFYGRAHLNLAVSGKVNQILRSELKIKPSKTATLYNSVNMAQYATTPANRKAARKALGLKPTDFLVIGNGQLQPRKRVDSFIAAARALPHIKFTWIGGIPFEALGADAKGMKKLVSSAPDNVTFTGLIDHDEVYKYLHAADLFWLPAEQENHPMCVLEAAGAGLPILLRNIPEYNDTFRGDAILADDDTFVAEITRLSRDLKYREKALIGTRKIADRFDSHTAALEIIAHYERLLDRKTKPQASTKK